MPSGDIPQVEAEIEAVRLAVLSDWRRNGGRGLQDLLDELQKERDRETRRRQAVALAAALLLFSRALEAPPSQRLILRARASARRLIVAGIRFAELSGGRLRASGPTVDRAAREAARELVTLSRARAQNSRFADRLQAAAADIQAAERELGELDRLRADVESSDRKEETKERRRREISERRREVEAGRRSAIAAARRTVEDRNGALSTAVADAWAYRAFNLGVFLAARAVGVRELIAVNPDDERTTPFCHWVNGKVIDVRRVSRKVDAYLSAVKSGDRDQIVQAWPFIKQNPGALRDLAAENSGSLQQGFRRFFARVGLPPYHFKCRTRAIPRITFGRAAA